MCLGLEAAGSDLPKGEQGLRPSGRGEQVGGRGMLGALRRMRGEPRRARERWRSNLAYNERAETLAGTVVPPEESQVVDHCVGEVSLLHFYHHHH